MPTTLLLCPSRIYHILQDFMTARKKKYSLDRENVLAVKKCISIFCESIWSGFMSLKTYRKPIHQSPDSNSRQFKIIVLKSEEQYTLSFVVVLGCEFLCREKTISCACTDPGSRSCKNRQADSSQWGAELRQRPMSGGEDGNGGASHPPPAACCRDCRPTRLLLEGRQQYDGGVAWRRHLGGGSRTTMATMIYRLPTVPTPNWLPPLATRNVPTYVRTRERREEQNQGGRIRTYDVRF